MPTDVGSLRASVSLDAAQYIDGLSKADLAAQKLEASQKRSSAALDRQVKALQQEATVLGLSAREAKLYTLEQKGATQWQLAAADAALKRVEAQQQLNKAIAAQPAGQSAAAMQMGDRSASGGLGAASAAAAVGAAPAIATDSEKFIASLTQQAATAGKSKAELLALQAAELGVTTQAAPLIAQIAKAGEATHEFGFKTAQSKRELIVLGHELSQGNYSKFGGSMMVLAEQTGLAGLAFSAAGLAIGGAAAVAAAAVAAFAIGASEQHALQTALILTGDAAGLTQQGFHDLAASIAHDVSGTTIRGAEDTLLGLVSAGKLSGDALAAVAKASASFQAATGQDAETVNAKFLKGVDDIGKFAVEVNSQYHLMTAAQIEYIKYLDDTGQHQRAVETTFDSLSDRMNEQAKNIGAIAAAWQFARRTSSEYISGLLQIGKTPTPDASLRYEQGKLAEMKAGQNDQPFVTGDEILPSTAPSDRDIARQEAVVDALKRQVALQNEQVAARAKDAGLQQAQTTYAADLEKYQSREVERQKAIDKLVGDAARARDLDPAASIASIKSGASPNTIDPKLGGAIAKINEQFKAPATSTKGFLTDQDATKNAVARLEAQFHQVEDAYRDANDVVSALHAAGLTDEQHYQDQRAALIQAHANAEVLNLQQQNADLQRFIDSHKGDKSQSKASDDDARAISVNETKIQSIRDRTVNQLSVLKIGSDAYLASIRVGYLQAEQAAEDFLFQQKRADLRSIAALRMSPERASDTAARQGRGDKYDDDQHNLDNVRARQIESGQFLEEQKASYAKNSAIIADAKARDLEEFDDMYSRRRKAEADWTTGATRSMQTYVDASRNTAQLTADAFTSALGGIEDSLTNLLTTGKGGLKALGSSIASSVVRGSVKQVLGQGLSAFQGSDLAKSLGIGDTAKKVGDAAADTDRGLKLTVTTSQLTVLGQAASQAALYLQTIGGTGGVGGLGGIGSLFPSGATGGLLGDFDFSNFGFGGADLSFGGGGSVVNSAASTLGGLPGSILSEPDIGGLLAGFPGFAVGANRVPQDMLARIHKDEAIIPAAFNPWANGSAGMQALTGGQDTGAGAKTVVHHSPTIVINPPAGMSRETSMQLAATAARQVATANRRNN